MTHKFNEETSGKLGLNESGVAKFALKHKFNNNVTGGLVVPDVDLHRLATEQKVSQPAIGFSLDFKL